MAILYGTQSNGETLPVLVDQFGNLLAKGIDGEPGPPGPPGIGQLPPDPYEGAILGWEDGELSWVGGSVILPTGTYGPFTYIDDERLDVPQNASDLVNGQQLFMSDDQGNPAASIYLTDAIQSYVPSPSLSVTVSSPENSLEELLSVTDQPGYIRQFDQSKASFGGQALELIAGDQISLRGSYEKSIQEISIFLGIQTSPGTIQESQISTNGWRGNAPWRSASENVYSTPTTLDKSGSLKYIKSVTSNPESNQALTALWAITINGRKLTSEFSDGTIILSFPTSTNFEKFEVGEVVQAPDVAITAIDAATSKITVLGGDWNDSGSGVNSKLETEWRGDGSVALGLEGAIVLRENNKKWVDGFYVTAPEQRIAARKVGVAAIKRNTKRDQLR